MAAVYPTLRPRTVGCSGLPATLGQRRRGRGPRSRGADPALPGAPHLRQPLAAGGLFKLALLGALAFWAHLRGAWTPWAGLFDRHPSQNLLAEAGTGGRTLVPMARYDSAKTQFIYDPRKAFAVLLWRELGAPYVNGANDNASGVAVAAALFDEFARPRGKDR